MSAISEVYNKDTYEPFLAYCREKRFETMTDLSNCPFHQLSGVPGISTLLASRVRAVYAVYCKSHAQAPAVPEKAMTEPELVNFLHRFFAENKESLIRLPDLVKAAGGRAKRGDITKILQQVAWCQAVDKTTFFYAPAK